MAELYPALDDLEVLCHRCHRDKHKRKREVSGRREWQEYVTMTKAIKSSGRGLAVSLPARNEGDKQ